MVKRSDFEREWAEEVLRKYISSDKLINRFRVEIASVIEAEKQRAYDEGYGRGRSDGVSYAGA